MSDERKIILIALAVIVAFVLLSMWSSNDFAERCEEAGGFVQSSLTVAGEYSGVTYYCEGAERSVYP